MPFGIRRSPSICRITPPVLPSEEDTIAAMYNAKADAETNRSSHGQRSDSSYYYYHIVTNILTLFLAGDLSADSRKDSSHESPAPTLLQQDQRQHRLAARRQATAQAGTVHATSKIKTSAGVSAIAQPLSGEVFGAAPQPAVAKQTHAVFKDKPNPEQRPSPLTTPPDLPSPTHLGSTKGMSLPVDGKP